MLVNSVFLGSQKSKVQGYTSMTTEIITILAAFASEFSRPTLKNIQVLLIGAILCRGPRRVSSVLRIMGLASIRNFSKYHRVLSRAEWDGLALAKILIGDGAYACMDLAVTCINRRVTLISRLRLDAQLYQFPIYEKKKLGRKSISDILSIVRRSIWSEKYFAKSGCKPDLDKCTDENIFMLIYQLSLAA